MTDEELREEVKKQILEGLKDFEQKTGHKYKAYLASEISIEEVKNDKEIQRKTDTRDS